MIGRAILRRFSHPPATNRYNEGSIDAAYDYLAKALPEVRRIQADDRVLDFGCGTGAHAVAIARTGADVTGIDIVPQYLVKARQRAKRHGVRVRFSDAIDDGERFDVILSYNSFEHFDNPGRVMRQMRDLLAPDGLLLLAFSPPWYSAYGAHMHHITPVPWVHLIFSERTVLAVRSEWCSDGATRYEEVEGGLNRMSVRRFERILQTCGMRAVKLRYTATKDLPFVTSIPVLRELLTTRVAAVLTR